MFFNWLKRVWLWLRHNVVYFFPGLSGFKRDHDSDDSEDERVHRVPFHSGSGLFDEIDDDPNETRRNRVPCHSGTGFFDENDHVPYSDRPNLTEAVLNGEICDV